MLGIVLDESKRRSTWPCGQAVEAGEVEVKKETQAQKLQAVWSPSKAAVEGIEEPLKLGRVSFKLVIQVCS